MRVYMGQSRGRKVTHKLIRAGVGEMTCPGELPPRNYPYAFDNGAFRDWNAGRDFQTDAFLASVDLITYMHHAPDFVVCPDIVAGGLDSLRFSMDWVGRLPALPIYLAVQDGMAPKHISHYLSSFAGLFVGGTLPWKIQTGRMWVDFAHKHRMPCHIGRVGTQRRLRWAQRIGADSIDSSLPLWTHEGLDAFLWSMENQDPQTGMFA